MNNYYSTTKALALHLVVFLAKLGIMYTYGRQTLAITLITGNNEPLPAGAIVLPITDLALHYLVPNRCRI